MIMVVMLLDINGPEFILLIVLAIILFGPERLPELARKAARILRYVRTMAGTAQEQLSKELGPGFEDLDLRDLNPKAFVQKHLLEDVEPILADVKSELTAVGKPLKDTAEDVTRTLNGDGDDRDPTDEPLAAAARTPFDPEAT
jgi:sec-independent protein translocase protein TatB